MQGFLDFDDSFDSYIPANLLPIPLALNCRTVYVLSPLFFSVDGAGVGDGEDGGGVD